MSRILLLGGSGFLGGFIAARLLAHGFQVRAVVREPAMLARTMPALELVPGDLQRDLLPEHWRERLAGCDAVINCAGLLRDPGLQAVHVDGPRALYQAAAAAGMRRGVLISAISADAEAGTAYARSKLEGEQALREHLPDWTVLRPSLVFGESSYGGTSLLRGLAAFPLVTPVPAGGDTARFSPIHVEDLAELVVRAAKGALVRQTVALCGPQELSLLELVRRERAWLGLRPVPLLRVPRAIVARVARLGDRIGRGPISTTALAQLEHGNQGDGSAAAAATGFQPRGYDQARAERPAGVQERWHARLYFLRPAARWSLALLWLGSGLIGLLSVGDPRWPLLPALLGCFWDLVLGAALLRPRAGRVVPLAAAQLLTIAVYSAALTWLQPGLWLDPLGSLTKNIAVAIAVLAWAALEDDR